MIHCKKQSTNKIRALFIIFLIAAMPCLLRGQPPNHGILELRRDSQTLLLTAYGDILIDSTLLVNSTFGELSKFPERSVRSVCSVVA